MNTIRLASGKQYLFCLNYFFRMAYYGVTNDILLVKDNTDTLEGDLEHEIIHDVLYRKIGKKACRKWDNVSELFYNDE